MGKNKFNIIKKELFDSYVALVADQGNRKKRNDFYTRLNISVRAVVEYRGHSRGLSSQEDQDDLVQDILLSFLKKEKTWLAGEFESQEKLLSYLKHLVNWRLDDWGRKRKRTQNRRVKPQQDDKEEYMEFTDTLPSQYPDPCQEFEQRYYRELFENEIQKMDSGERAVAAIMLQGQTKPAAIAKELVLNVQEVYKAQSRIRYRLKKILPAA